MSQIHFIGGEKGGVGKSVLTRLLAQYHIDRGLPFRAFDTDRSHGAMLRFYGEYSQPIMLDEFASADQLIEAAVENQQDVLVLDALGESFFSRPASTQTQMEPAAF